MKIFKAKPQTFTEMSLPIGKANTISPSITHASTTNIYLLKREYEDLYKAAVLIESQRLVLTNACRSILIEKYRYRRIAERLKIPWYMLACIHYREASLSFRSCLHNGDPLPGPTINVPKGRGPFKSWEDSVIDAFNIQKLPIIDNLYDALYHMEAYNGWGYRMYHGKETSPANASPYIFSGTQFYQSGMYSSDGHFDKDKADQRPGCIAIIKFLEMTGEKIV